jgi:hypothetical protein
MYSFTEESKGSTVGPRVSECDFSREKLEVGGFGVGMKLCMCDVGASSYTPAHCRLVVSQDLTCQPLKWNVQRKYALI